MEEIHEMHEHAEHAAEDPSLVPVTFTMAVLAVLVAMATLLGHRSHTHELLIQSKATDVWAEYQAKNIRMHSYEMFAEVMSVTDFKDAEKAEKVRERFHQQAEKYEKEKEGLQEKAKEFEAEVQTEMSKANRFDLGEAMLEMGLVITSICLLTRKRGFWFAGMLLGAAGIASAALGLLIH